MKPLLIPRNIILPITAIGFLIVLIGAWTKITHMSLFGLSPNIILNAGMILSVPGWIVSFVDMLRNKIKNSFMWLICLLFMGVLGSLIYLLRRNQILSKQTNRNT